MRDATLLIDTGAVVSLVNKTMVPDIELLNIKPNYKHIVSATGQPLNITGIIECEISVNSDVSVHNMYVVEDLLYDAIIGTDIMKRLGIVIDMKDEAAYWNNMYVKFIGSDDQNCVKSSALFGVNLIHTVDIPARSEMICFGRINGDVNGMIGIVEPKGQLTSKYSVIPARVLTKACDKDVVFKVLNPTSKPVKLFKDTNIGTFEEIDKVLDEEYNSDVVPTSHVVNSLCEGISKEMMQDVQVDWEQLSNSEQEQLSELLNEFSDIFAKSDSDLGKTNLVSHSIDTQGHGAVKQRPYRVPFSQREEIRTQIQDMLDRDIIRPSHSCWASPDLTFVWSEDCEIAFNSLKRALVTSSVLQYPDFEKPFILYCDACDFGVGAVLAQKTDPNEKLDNPIGYASRQLRKHELNYAVIEKEALAIVWAVDHFCQYLYGHKFTVITDHNPLRWLMTVKNPSGRLARWSLALQEYDLTIEYRSGKLHGNADGLSRRGETQTVVAGLTEISPAGLQLDVIKDLQIKDPNLRPIIDYLKDGNLPEQITNARKVMACSPDYELFDGILHHFGHLVQENESM
ncbi:Retrovirus-related Pol polyprotein from transposon 297,Retrovirus-related Pol polyprotein from transposon 412 [Mytilus coruscus]|uniref:Retrovirus-related Pol polyprotein from transposon 297,Retrovirus-related Pol polyprotein from transposon 412 n=1 Tax=Mytilus coruscus TaxID=42192 RepID=A0A6J8A0G3_MYTCO|nr:Retrovirus-related Pol polyprotein from transposon 297,Retrovirus-related Pol polyprotein from transposon 412 [Mytilus coruscus]